MQEILNIIIPLLIGLGLIIIGFNFREKNKGLMRNGIEAEGVIFSTEASGNSNSNTVYPIIRFVTKEGLWITETADMALPSFLLKKGKQVKVFYNPENPKEFIYKTTFDFSKLIYLFISAGTILLLAGIWFAYKYLTKQN